MKRILITLALAVTTHLCQAQGLTGVWTWGKETGSGGTLKIIDEGGKLTFQLTCYRMRSVQFVGDISGEVVIRKRRGVFRSPELPDCRIVFRVEGNAITLEQTGKGDCEFGTGVQADGTYRRRSSAVPTFD